MGGMLPGEADPAVQLNVLERAAQEGRRTRRARHRDGQRGLRRVLLDRPRRVRHRGQAEVDLDREVGTAVLDRLERPDHPAELDPGARVADRALQGGLASAVLLAGDCGCDRAPYPGPLPGRPLAAEWAGGRRIEGDRLEVAHQVLRLGYHAVHAVGAEIDDPRSL